MNKSLSAELGTFDFVYSAGLYDYLDQRLATRLTAKLFDYLRPEGRLLLANFHTNNHGTGFMEAFMDWWLIYRTDEQMLSVANEIHPAHIQSTQQYQDPFGNVTYLEIHRIAK
jgi:cyclopropane fatty-acyl-phospholipid synthase-like methyltransferase